MHSPFEDGPATGAPDASTAAQIAVGNNPGEKPPRDFFDRLRRAEFTKGKRELEHCASLAYRYHHTSGARFETARRHKKKNRTSQIAIMILTSYAILFSMISTIVKTDENRDLLSLLALFMSSFTLAVAIYESSKRYDMRSEMFLRCAMDVQALRDRAVSLVISDTATWDIIGRLEEEYNSTLRNHADNHSHIDYDAFRANTGKLKKSRLLHRALYWLNVWLFALLAFVSPAIVVMMYKASRYLI